MKLCMGCMEQYDDELTRCPHCGFVENTKPENAIHMEPGSILADRYIIGKVIGFGGFGVTYIGWDALMERKVAVKEYLPSEFSTRVLGQTQVTVFSGDKAEQFNDGLKKFVEEAKKLANFNSTPGIVKVYDTFEYNQTAYIIMELLVGETLAEILSREGTIPEDRAIKMMMPVIESLKEVHKDGIIHRDIAPDNIFVTNEGEVKLIDFGAARYATTTHSRSLTVIIKPGYSPEEQYRSRGDQGPYTDVYAVAATLYKMITGQTPPDALERRAYFENQKKDILPPLSKYVKDISENRENAILNALNVRIEDRTEDMDAFIDELTSEEPVKRRAGKIQKIDIMKWPMWAKIGVPTMAVILLVFSILLSTGHIIKPANLNEEITYNEGQTRVPNVINNLYSDAEVFINNNKLQMVVNNKESSERIPENMILSQDINGGSVVMENTIIGVVVSAGVIKQTVPDVVGLNIDEARTDLENLKFKVNTVEVYDDVVSENCVVSQSEEAGSEIREGSTIVLNVSKGRDPSKQVEEKEVTLSNLVGKSYSDAVKEAQKLGVQIKVKERRYSKNYPKDTVMEQNPAANSKIKNTQVVELVVSLGYEQVEVPDVTFLTEEKAKSQLTGKGLKAKVTYKTDDSVAAGLVISQDPKAKSKVDPESTVNIVVSKGATAFAMPNVVGLSESEATSTLTSKGLAVSINYEQNDNKPEGEVLRQSVAAGTNVSRGNNIVLTVATSSGVVNVPNVVGKSQSDAERSLTDAGFKVNVESVPSDTVAKGVVISQSPEGGIGLTKGSVISINVSTGKKAEEAAPMPKPAVTSNVASKSPTVASKPAAVSSKPATITPPVVSTKPVVSTPESKVVSKVNPPTPSVVSKTEPEPPKTYTYYFLAPDDYFKTDEGADNSDVGVYWWTPRQNADWPGVSMQRAPDIGENVFKIENVSEETYEIQFNDFGDKQTGNVGTSGYSGNCPYDGNIKTDNFDGWIYVLNNHDIDVDNTGIETVGGAWFRLDNYKNYEEYYGSYELRKANTKYRVGDKIKVEVTLGNLESADYRLGAYNYEVAYDDSVMQYVWSEAEDSTSCFVENEDSVLKIGMISSKGIKGDYTGSGTVIQTIEFEMTQNVDAFDLTGLCTSLTIVSSDGSSTEKLIEYNDGDYTEGLEDVYTGFYVSP